MCTTFQEVCVDADPYWLGVKKKKKKKRSKEFLHLYIKSKGSWKETWGHNVYMIKRGRRAEAFIVLQVYG